MHETTKRFGLLGIAIPFIASCGLAKDAEGIDVAEDNELGVVSLQTERSVDHDNEVFVLRGLSADGQEQASVKLTRGVIADFVEMSPTGDPHGSEILISAGGEMPFRAVTQEPHEYRLDAASFAHATGEFLAIAQVSSTLKRELNLVIIPKLADGSEQALSTTVCTASQHNTTPLLKDCCASGTLRKFHFTYMGSPETIGTLYRNPYGTGCKAADGVSSCNGTGCYYGPNGNSMPVRQTKPMGNYFAKINFYPGPDCTSEHVYNVDPDTGPDITGTFATGQTCPGAPAASYGYWDVVPFE